MSNITLTDLFQKYLEDELSPEEFARLYGIIREEYDAAALDALLEKAFSDQRLAGSAKDHDKKAVFALLQEKIREKENSPAPVLPLSRRHWFAGVAAAVLLLLAGAIYWYTARHHTNLPQAEDKVAGIDVPPGHAGAVLTLADGRQILLDSARNGLVRQQGGAQLLKQEGKLSYTSGGEAEGTILYNTMTTAKGRQYQLVLSDGTKVWLNAASSIRYPTTFSGKERRVEVSGEAYFEVAQNKSKPFIATIGQSQITVLGTSFDVMGYDDEKSINTTLVEGAVSLSTGTQKMLLSPGRQAMIERTSGKLTARQVDTDPIIAWTRGQLSLGGMDLAGLMRQISRWYDVDIEFEGKVPELHVGGIIDRDLNLSAVMEFLGQNGLQYRTEKKKIIILP